MLLPETEINMARERTKELLRQDQQYKEMIALKRRAAQREHKPQQRNWFQQLLLGKIGA